MSKAPEVEKCRYCVQYKDLPGETCPYCKGTELQSEARKVITLPAEEPLSFLPEGRPAFRFGFDPISLVLEVAHGLYPTQGATIYLVPEIKVDQKGLFTEEAYGMTFFPEGEEPTIFISLATPLGDVMEALTEEIAHVVVGKADDYGPEWKTTVETIEKEYARRIERMSNHERAPG